MRALAAAFMLMILAPNAIAADRRFSEADEAVYNARFDRLMEAARTGGRLDQYDTLAPVAGADAPAPLPAANAGERTIRPAALVAAAEYAGRMNSSAFLVWRGNRLEFARYYGVFDRRSPIVSKSLAKPVTAILVGRAIALGHIESLDQPVADFITEWQGDPRRSKMLIRHLLDMRTGLRPQEGSFDATNIMNRAYLHPRHDELIIREYPLVDEPGTRYGYSNATSELVAPLIERATGMPYEAFLSEALLKPIGAMGGEIWMNRPGGTAHSGCCLLLPAESWMRMGILLLNRGVWDGNRLLPAGYVEEMRRGTDENPYYGLGVWVAGPYTERRGYAHPDRDAPKVLHSQPYAAEDLFLFDGNSNQVVYIVPSQDLIILRTGETPPPEPEWDNSYLPNLIIGAIDRKAGERPPTPQHVRERER